MLKIWKIHRKSRIKPMQVLFCKYFRNESSDLHENYYPMCLSVKFHEDPCINTRVWVMNSHVHILSQLCAFTTLARAFMHVSSWNLKLKHTRYEDMKIWAFVAEIFAKQYWRLLNPYFSMYFSYFQHFSIKVPSKF